MCSPVVRRDVAPAVTNDDFICVDRATYKRVPICQLNVHVRRGLLAPTGRLARTPAAVTKAVARTRRNQGDLRERSGSSASVRTGPYGVQVR
jgi:hypothetical protein